MANPNNPARQSKAMSSHRPGKSPRLTEHTAKANPRPGTGRTIVFLMDTPEADWIVHDLCRIMTQSGHSSRLHPLHETAYDGQTQLKRAGDYTYWLLATTSTAVVKQYKFDDVVLLVPANLEAVLAAYQHITRLAQANPPDIGVVLLGAQDQQTAWRYFRRLAVGALRYLDISLLNLGFLPQQVTPRHRPQDHHGNHFLARISERLLRSEFYNTLYPTQQFTPGQGLNLQPCHCSAIADDQAASSLSNSSLRRSSTV